MMTDEKTYEMMWDCEFCGKQKLLGKTHRHCPNCGGPQNPERRYFPPEEEKVAVEDHEYVGADLMCPACNEATSRAANNCGNCGSPLTGAKGAGVQQEQVVGPGGAVVAAPGQPAAGAAGGQPGGQPAKAKSKVGCIAGAVGAVVLLLIVAVLVGTCWKKEAAFEVAGHQWKREIAIERYEAVKEKKDCKEMPSGAKEVKRTKGKKECKTRKVDQGDGTFKEKKECKTPAETCEYTITRWQTTRTAKAEGSSVDDQVLWPTVKLRKKGNCEGCERQGEKSETYTVTLKDQKSGETDGCTFAKDKWASFKKGSKWKGKVRMVGGIDCSSLKPQ